MKIYINYFIILFIMSFQSCNTVEPPIDIKTQKQWEPIQELSNLSVRYILKHDKTLYLSAVESNKDYRGVIWKTNDGNNWIMLRTFEKAIGPLTTHGDTLYCLGDSLFRYIIPLEIWENVCQPKPLTSDVQAVSEMIFLKNKLYAMQTFFSDAVATYRINFDGTVENISVLPEIGPSYGGAKFIKNLENAEYCYVRGQYYKGGFYSFNGKIFTKIKEGLTNESWIYPPTNSMEIKNDTLFAGFRYPGVIKFLNNNIWTNYSDPLPLTKEGNKIYNTEPTEITFVDDKMFVSTDALGVLEWKKDSGWIQFSKGLLSYSWVDLYYPIVFLESIKNILIASYGDPGYAPWGGIGVYKYKIN